MPEGRGLLGRPGRLWSLRNFLVVSQIAMLALAALRDRAVSAKHAERRQHGYRPALAGRPDDVSGSAAAWLHSGAHYSDADRIARARGGASRRCVGRVHRCCAIVRGQQERWFQGRRPTCTAAIPSRPLSCLWRAPATSKRSESHSSPAAISAMNSRPARRSPSSTRPSRTCSSPMRIRSANASAVADGRTKSSG